MDPENNIWSKVNYILYWNVVGACYVSQNVWWVGILLPRPQVGHCNKLYGLIYSSVDFITKYLFI